MQGGPTVNPIERRWTQKQTADAVEVKQADSAEETSQTFICEGARFEGTLSLGRQNLRIDCEFKGEIVTDGKVIIGQGGAIESDIRAREVVIYGAVVGNVYASRLLELRAGGKLHGDIETPCLQVERHGFFNGVTKMARPEASLPDSETSETNEKPAPRGKAASLAPSA
jgi:cytoskeletal protein CcmA (bactofilin family)